MATTSKETHNDGPLGNAQGTYAKTKHEEFKCHQAYILCHFAYE
jgi:hypothetical protein